MDSIAVEQARETIASLKRWLVKDAYPMWWTKGADHRHGGFHERLTQDAQPTHEPRRGRLHPRQIFSFALAAEFEWQGPAQSAVQHALDFFLKFYSRPDGLFRTCVTPDGAPLNDDVVLYDQAFALLGFASAMQVSGEQALEARARELLTRMRAELGHTRAGFNESKSVHGWLLSNSHMHLLEASLAWGVLDPAGPWMELAEELVELALKCFLDASSGLILEFFDQDWRPAPGVDGRIAEPGHQYEWAWLFFKWGGQAHDPRMQELALGLIQRA
jgi:mannose-6-phosphate isomerase